MANRIGIAVAASICIVLSGCKDLGVDAVATGPNVQINIVTPQTVLGKPAHEILHIISAKILWDHVCLCTAGGGDSLYVSADPIAVDLDLTAHAKILLAGRIPAGTFDRIRFTIHQPDTSETLPDPAFADSTHDYQRCALVVEGLYHETPFTFRSQQSVRLEVLFTSPVTVPASGEVNLTVLIDPYAWFTEGPLFYDPWNQVGEINDRIRNAPIEAFRDNDRNGQPD
jgi:hypothetical protein